MNGSMIINIFNEKNDENDKIFMWKWNSSFLRSSNDERFVNSLQSLRKKTLYIYQSMQRHVCINLRISFK